MTMAKEIETWQLILYSVQVNLRVMLMYVVESKGSSPGRAGFVMAVNEQGAMAGSLGGGIMEHKFVEMAKMRLGQQGFCSSIHRQVHNKKDPHHQSGMICSGEQTIALFQVTSKEQPVVEKVIAALQQNTPGWIELTASQLNLSDKQLFTTGLEKLSEHSWRFCHPVGFKNRLYIIGGGHCSLALSKVAAMLDFFIHVFEHREDLNTFLENQYAHQKTVVEDYSQLADLIAGGENDYLVIMTFGYRTDDFAIRALIHHPFKYMGLLGSESKIAKMMSDYQHENFATQRLPHVFAPIGLSINSKTPEEIAISIAAQIIAVKNGAIITSASNN